MNENDTDSSAPPRSRRTTALATLVARATKPVFRQRGLADGAVLRDWPKIVGPELARRCIPERVRYPRGERSEGTLHLRVESGGLATELQHLEPLLIERINGYFGYRAVARLRLVQGPIVAAETPENAPPQPLDAAEQARIGRVVAEIEDPDLRRALSGLGAAVATRRRDEQES